MRRRLVAAVALAMLALAPAADAWTWPVDGPVLRPFSLSGDTYAAGQHRGVDVGAALGTPVVAPAGGTISFAGQVPGGGHAVTIQTADGYAVTLLQLASTSVLRGSGVAEGEVVGAVGESADTVTIVPHVHLGVRLASDADGYVDPVGLLPVRPPVEPPAPQPAVEPEAAPAVVPVPVETAEPWPPAAAAPAPAPAETGAEPLPAPAGSDAAPAVVVVRSAAPAAAAATAADQLGSPRAGASPRAQATPKEAVQKPAPPDFELRPPRAAAPEPAIATPAGAVHAPPARASATDPPRAHDKTPRGAATTSTAPVRAHATEPSPARLRSRRSEAPQRPTAKPFVVPSSIGASLRERLLPGIAIAALLALAAVPAAAVARRRAK